MYGKRGRGQEGNEYMSGLCSLLVYSREESVVLYCKAGECMGRGVGAGSPVNAWGSGRGQE